MSTAATPGRPRDTAIDAAVLEAARKHLASVGYESMSLVAVAEEAGTTRQALYRRWANKADLATAAIASMSAVEDRPETDDPYADLVAELTAFRAGVTRRNGVSLVGSMLQDSADRDLVRLFRQRIVAPRRARLEAILERGRGAGLLATDADTEYAAAAGTGVLYALSVAGSPIDDDWARRTAALLWRACGGQRAD